MDSPKTNAPQPRPLPLPVTVPDWAQARVVNGTAVDAAFAAGSALASLDRFAKADLAWGGCWRKRLALRSAVAALRLSGRNVEEATLRDALLLHGESDDPGPTGHVLLGFRKLTRRVTHPGTALLTDLAAGFGLREGRGFSEIADLADDLLQRQRAVPVLIAALVREVLALRPDAEVLAWWLADWLLAEKLRWTRPVPLLMAERFGPAFRTAGGRGRLQPQDADFERAVALALVSASAEACRLGNDLMRRSEHLLAVAPRLRSKGADAVVHRLLEEESLLATAPGPALSRWASSRLFERLQALDAVRELSGRSTFRIYGL